MLVRVLAQYVGAALASVSTIGFPLAAVTTIGARKSAALNVPPPCAVTTLLPDITWTGKFPAPWLQDDLNPV
jgi:hypothetical protein